MELSTLQVYNISHFVFSFASSISHEELRWRKKKNTKHLSFFPSFISEEMGGEGVSVEVGKKGQHSKLQKSRIKKKNPNKIKTHRKWNTSS